VISRKRKFRSSDLGVLFGVLSKKDKQKLSRVLSIQVALGFLDLLGVATIGALGALAVRGIQSQSPGTKVTRILEFARISNLSFQNQVMALAIFATILLISRTLLSVFFTRKILRFLSVRSAQLTVDLFRGYLHFPFQEIQRSTSQEVIFSLTQGVSSLMMGVVATTTTLIADISLLLIMSAGLFLLDPLMAFSTFATFSAVAVLLYKLLNSRALQIGQVDTQLSIETGSTIFKVKNSYKENFVKANRWRFINEVERQRMAASHLQAELAFMPSISKYAIEFTVVVGALILCAIQFSITDATHAVAILSVFLAAGTRIAPAVMRVQQGLVQIKSSLGASRPTLKLIEMQPALPSSENQLAVSISSEEFSGTLEISNLTFSYDGNSDFKLGPINVSIQAGESLALVGKSGSGKSTLVDLVMGLLEPSTGFVAISGLSPKDSIQNWPGLIGYVPQDVTIFDGTLLSNVCLGFRIDEADREAAWDALEKAQLGDFARALKDGLDTQVGENGAFLSGGQRQRLGIARALYSKPKFLILDEATSALDGLTEQEVTTAISRLAGEVTLLVIAHRLATIKDIKNIIYLENGIPGTIGDFSHIRSTQPDFDAQAKRMGL
jgi:ABC-type multidrug transport system fused ATPase/permease subunit